MNGFENGNFTTQTALIREYLMQNGEIDGDTARQLCGTTRLSAHIHILRHDPDRPMEIVTERRKFIGMLGHHGTYGVYHYNAEEQNNG